MPLVHVHVAAVPLEVRQLVGSSADLRVVGSGHRNVVRELRKAAGAAGHARGELRHSSPPRTPRQKARKAGLPSDRYRTDPSGKQAPEKSENRVAPVSNLGRVVRRLFRTPGGLEESPENQQFSRRWRRSCATPPSKRSPIGSPPGSCASTFWSAGPFRSHARHRRSRALPIWGTRLTSWRSSACGRFWAHSCCSSPAFRGSRSGLTLAFSST